MGPRSTGARRTPPPCTRPGASEVPQFGRPCPPASQRGFEISAASSAAPCTPARAPHPKPLPPPSLPPRRPRSSVNSLRLGRLTPVDDLFGLGSALLELQCGRLPWSGLMDGSACGQTAPAGGAGGGGGGGGAGGSGSEARASDDGDEFGPARLAQAAAVREREWGLAVRQARGAHGGSAEGGSGPTGSLGNRDDAMRA
jgi:hypothetical protein